MKPCSAILAASVGAMLLAACSTTGDPTLAPSTLQLPSISGLTPKSAPAVTYTYDDLGPGPNGKDAFGLGLSGSAQSGSYVDHTISCGKACSAKVYYPLAWSGPGSQPVVLLPQFYAEGWAYGAGGNDIVGTLITNNGGYFGYPHAALWRGSSHTFVDLNPSGTCGSCSPGSNAYATDGTSVVGSGGATTHALLWKLNNLKAPIDLHPSGFAYSEAYAVRGAVQAGYAYSSATNSEHAILWNSSAAGAVDLTPPALSSAYAATVTDRSEVGCGIPSGANVTHAILWHGSASSMKDLQPAGFADSCARGAYGSVQVGYGHAVTSNALHAIVWSGSAKSAVDLQQFLPSTFTSSQAYAVNAAGEILGSAFSTTTGSWHAILWHS